MEPGHEDREYLRLLPQRVGRLRASMEPGHEDREYSGIPSTPPPTTRGLNGARS